MYISRAMDIVDQETGEVYYTCHSKYGGQATLENAARYCKRHGYKCEGFDTNSWGHVFMWVTAKEDK